jgi:hypothetical protein
MRIRKRQLVGSMALAAILGGSPLVIDIMAPSAAEAQVIDEGYFYESLAPHGQWFFQAEFGWVWHPTHIATGWRPYTEGQWVWSDEVGWTWASYEPFGWATYHYGRWYFDPIYGWSWVPGTTWAPAWVSWRVESSYIGWAPLWPVYFDIHPEYRWTHWGYDDDWHHRHGGRDWDRWVFCRDRDFTSDRISRVAIRDRHERDRIFRDSRDVTRWEGGRPDRIGYSIDRERIERVSREPIRRVRLEDTDRPLRGENRVEGDRFRVFRPRVQEADDKTPDRLGIAKAPRDLSEAQTLRREKERLERATGKSARTDVARERDNERGGAPETVERERGAGRKVQMPTETRGGADDSTSPARDRNRPGRQGDTNEVDQRGQRGPEPKDGTGVEANRNRGDRQGGTSELDQRGQRGREPNDRTGAEANRNRGAQKQSETQEMRRNAPQDRGERLDAQGRRAEPKGQSQNERLWKPEKEPAGRAADGSVRGAPARNERQEKRQEQVDTSPRQPNVSGREARPASRSNTPARSYEAQRGPSKEPTRGPSRGQTQEMRRESPSQPAVRREGPARYELQDRPRPQPQPKRMQSPQRQRQPEVREAPRRQEAPKPAPTRVQREPEPRVQQHPQRSQQQHQQQQQAPARRESPSPQGDAKHGGGPQHGRSR